MRTNNLIFILFFALFSLALAGKQAQAAAGGDWLVHLGLYGSQAQAGNAWQVLNATHPGMFSGLAPEYWTVNTGSQSILLLPGRQEINTGGATMHLLGVGRFGTQDEASALCGNLKASGGNCFVAQYRPIGPGSPPPAAALVGQPPPPSVTYVPPPQQQVQQQQQAEAPAPEQAVAGNRVIIWGGVDVKDSSYYTYAGSVQSLSGKSIYTQDGFLIKEAAGFGDFSFKKSGVAGDVTGTVRTADLSLGYKKVFENGGIAIYAGGSVENHQRSANDAGNDVIGTHAGFIASTDGQVRLSDRFTLMGMASYATANQSYWTHFAAGYAFDAGKIGRMTFGPTVGFSGGEDYDVQRYGASLADINIGFANMYVYSGYEVCSNSDNNGVYSGIGFGKSF